MGFRCGIVGLPNVGKSTLFNALTATAAAEAANYPFCTIEPNVGRVAVPDKRLHELARIAASKQVIPAQMEFVDIAGLVKGASQGEGLGNQFLAHIREVDAILHVVRCFEDTDITHVEGSVDPVRDAEIIETELMLSDLESLERRMPNLEKKAKGGDKDAKETFDVAQPVLAALRAGKMARTAKPVEQGALKHFLGLQLLTGKPMLYVCNVAEGDANSGNRYTAAMQDYARKQDAGAVTISAAIESDIAQLDSEADKADFLAGLGLSEPGLHRLIQAGYALLNLQTYFTVGPKEARAWTIPQGATAPEAAGVIHSDFQRGFICAETITYGDYITCKGETKAKETGKLRQEGKGYVVQDGDVMNFRFNV